MRFLILLRVHGRGEARWLSSRSLLELWDYDEELVKAGVLLAAERLHADSARVLLSNLQRTATAVADSTEPIGGFWLIQATSKAEAIEWARRCPKPDGVDAEVEIREVITR